MVDVVVSRSERLKGEVCAPPSKAYTHRTLIAALLSNGVSRISNPLSSNDTQATVRAILGFGAEVEQRETAWTVRGTMPLNRPVDPIDCAESGATLRFMTPVAALAPGTSSFNLEASLARRPINPLLRCLKQLGAACKLQNSEKGWYVEVQGGGIKGGRASIRGDISSQFISGLMFACPMAEKTTEIDVTTPVESKSYIQATAEVLDRHCVKVSISNDFRRFDIPSNQQYRQYDHEIPGDFSSAAFVLAAAAINSSSKVRVKNLDYRTTQGDKAILDILKQMGSTVYARDGYVEVEGNQLQAVEIDARNNPDLVPVCAALACYSKGTSKILNARRLRYKESDRLASLNCELNKMGAKIREGKDDLIIEGPSEMHGAVIDPHNDHRIAMACTIAALHARGRTRIQGSECVSKSYPRFFDDLRSLGADIGD